MRFDVLLIMCRLARLLDVSNHLMYVLTIYETCLARVLGWVSVVPPAGNGVSV